MNKLRFFIVALILLSLPAGAKDASSPSKTARQAWWKPYSAPCVERENVFEFTEKPAVKYLGNDKYEITFATKGYCDATVEIVDRQGKVVRHVGSGVLGPNAPAPFQQNSLKQTVTWHGKDDLDIYPREPGKLRVRVMLGLKPEFDKRLGGASPYDIPGLIRGIAVDESGVYVFSTGPGGQSHPHLRKFGHDLAYVASLIPPPANLPESKLGGMSYVEYEPGKKALQGPDWKETLEEDGRYLPVKAFPKTWQPAIVDGRIYYTNYGVGTYKSGYTFQVPRKAFEKVMSSSLYYIYTDGSTDLTGCSHRPFIRYERGVKVLDGHPNPRLAASPDGKWIYMVNAVSSAGGETALWHTVWRCATADTKPAQVFIGTVGKPGSDNASFNGTSNVACDGEGRIYVCDTMNGRVQVFGADGGYLKTIKAEWPYWVGVHKKTGVVYLMHQVRVGKNIVPRVTKFSAFPEIKKVFHFDGIAAGLAALDSWTARPRLWVAPEARSLMLGGRNLVLREGILTPPQLTVWEERDGSFKKVLDFAEEARRNAGPGGAGWWNGGLGHRVWCDPVRERVYVDALCSLIAFCVDLPSGRFLECVRHRGHTYDFAFDKKGYMHGHFRPDLYQQGVGRYDPDQAIPVESLLKGVKSVRYKEAPYNYGVASPKGDHIGVLPVKDSGGDHSKGVDIGVNMRGDVAEECHVDYVPKMDDVGRFAWSHGGTRGYWGSGMRTYDRYLKEVKEMERRGDEVYFIRRRPGVGLVGATIWTFDSTGELREKCAVTTGMNINGLHMDEDGKLYFAVNRQRVRNGKVFLAGRLGVFGGESGMDPFMGTVIKSAGKNVLALADATTVTAPIPLEEPPARQPEIGGRKPNYWVNGAEWFYAGASPIPTTRRCQCKRMSMYTDWHKRSFVPEAYRHSIGIVDTNGNLILHMGRYGNLDSGDGPKSRIPVGGDGIAIAMNRFVSATDNYVVFDDNAERIVVVKLNYHADETVPVPTE